MEAFIATILPWPVRYAPYNWVNCGGQSFQVQQYQALYALIGTLYGGNGQTFSLPDLRNRVMVGSITISGGAGNPTNGPNAQSGGTGGAFLPTPNVSSQGMLTAANLPGHTHTANFSPVTGIVPVTVSAPAAAIPVTIPVGATTPSSAPAQPLSGSVYLTNATAGTNLRGLYATTAPTGSTATLTGGTATGNPGGTFTGTMNAVTGGNVTVQPNTTNNPTAFNTLGTTGQIPMPPYLAMGFIIATVGIWPDNSN